MNIKNLFGISKELGSTFFRLYKFLWKDLKREIIMILTTTVFLYTVFQLVSRGAQGLMINIITDYLSGKAIENNFIIIILITLVVSLIIPDVLGIISGFYEKVSWRKIDELVSIAYIKKKAELSIEQLENPDIDALLRRTSDNIWRIRSTFSNAYDIMRNLAMISAILISILIIKPSISLLIIVFTIPELMVELKAGKTVWTIEAISGDLKRKYFQLRNYFGMTSSVIDIKLSGNISFFTKKLYEIITPFLEEQYENDKKRTSGLILATIFSKIGIIIAIMMLISDVFDKKMQVGTFVFLFGLINTFQNSLSNFFRRSAQSYSDVLYVKDYFEVQDMDGAITYENKPIILPEKSTPKIEIRNVSFAYQNKDNLILDNINLTINEGEKIAIVGINGAGKTTLVKLLCRFYDVNSGEILIDGKNIKDIEISSWWKHIGYMQQDSQPYLFQAKESIAIGDTTAKINMDKVKKSAKMSLASEFIDKFKNGYSQQLGRGFEDSEGLSGGQWQRMTLARIFYRDPKIYILDEPTSAMDAEAESKIFDTLSKLPKDKTVIFISHRFSTIRQADRICVIEEGKISEIGSHKQLIANNKTYKRLFELQAKGYE